MSSAGLSRQTRLKKIPVIFVTALQEGGEETSGFEAGAVDFISKAINAAVVQARVKEAQGVGKLGTMRYASEKPATDMMVNELTQYRTHPSRPGCFQVPRGAP